MKKLLSLIILSAFVSIGFSQVRISQVYGGGGNAGATYKNDFIELFNTGTSPADISGYTIQYASAAGTSWQVSSAVPALTSIAGGKYFLISLAGGATGAALTADFSGSTTINMSGTAGKVALVNTNTALSGATACSSTSVVDVVGYGAAATCSEGGAPAPGAGVTSAQAIFRKLAGCTQSNNNGADFEILAVNPRNSSSPANSSCGGGSPALSATPSSLTSINAVTGTPSNEFNYSLSGTSLTAGPIVVTPSANIEISLTAGGPYTTSPLNISYTAPTLTATTVYARIANTAAAGAFSGTIDNNGGGATTTVTVSGSILVAESLVQASNISIANINDTGFDISWTPGDGTSDIVVVRPSTATEVAPADGSVYTVGGTTGASNTVEFVGTGSGPVTVTGLVVGTAYTIRVYEFNGAAGTANYLTTTAVLNPATAATTGLGPNLTITNFNAIAVPLYMGSNVVGTNNNYRVPVMFYAKVSGLVASTTYRYYIQGAVSTDLGTSASGAGSPILISYPVAATPTYAFTASGAFTVGNYATFTTDAAGTFTGGFGVVPTGNTRFTGGNTIIPSITLQKDVTPNGTIRLGLDQTISVMNFGTPIDSGTYIRGASSATPGNIIALWKSTDGSSFITGLARPLSMTLAEHPVFTSGTWATSFITGYDQSTGAWNAIMPNNNPAGVELIQQLDIATGNTVGCNSDADGIWPSGAVTVNPAAGATPVVITATDAPLNSGPCFSILAISLNAFNAIKVNNTVRLSWSTAQEINSNHFDVLRSADGITWTTISMVAAAGNSSSVLNYSVVDNNPLKGKNLYKLRFVDNSGKQSFSDIKMILFTARFSVIVYPNPVRDRINITLGSNGNSPVEITLVNATGAVVGKYITQSTSYSIDVTGLSKGMYILKVKADSFSDAEKIIIN
jgi:hypothetical protein